MIQWSFKGRICIYHAHRGDGTRFLCSSQVNTVRCPKARRRQYLLRTVGGNQNEAGSSHRRSRRPTSARSRDYLACFAQRGEAALECANAFALCTAASRCREPIISTFHIPQKGGAEFTCPEWAKHNGPGLVRPLPGNALGNRKQSNSRSLKGRH
jgi:hypothetical protein